VIVWLGCLPLGQQLLAYYVMGPNHEYVYLIADVCSFEMTWMWMRMWKLLVHCLRAGLAGCHIYGRGKAITHYYCLYPIGIHPLLNSGFAQQNI
jgi:hypothetical protein